MLEWQKQFINQLSYNKLLAIEKRTKPIERKTLPHDTMRKLDL